LQFTAWSIADSWVIFIYQLRTRKSTPVFLFQTCNRGSNLKSSLSLAPSPKLVPYQSGPEALPSSCILPWSIRRHFHASGTTVLSM